MKIKSDLQAVVSIFDLNEMGVTANEDMFPFLKLKLNSYVACQSSVSPFWKINKLVYKI